MSEAVHFTNDLGHRLAGRLHRPLHPRAWAVFAHCFTCGKDLRAARRIAEGLRDEGIGVLRFDFTGLGQSEGDFADTHFSSSVSDLKAAIDWLDATEQAPTLLVGHSLGGAAVLAAAASDPRIQAVATIGAPSEPAHVTHLLEPVGETLQAEGEAVAMLAGRPFRVRQDLVDDLRSQRLVSEVLPSLRGRSLLFLHSPQDATVGIHHAAALYGAARHPKSFVSLDGADHLMSRPQDARYAGKVIAAWAERYALTDAEHAGGKEREQVVARIEREQYTTHFTAGPHHFVGDEPPGRGADQGPTPYQFLLSALGGCTAMTLRMYADRKQLPLEAVEVTLRHRREPAAEPGKPPLQILERELVLEGPLDDASRLRLRQIADRCPVHRTLEGPLEIRTTTVEPSTEP